MRGRLHTRRRERQSTFECKSLRPLVLSSVGMVSSGAIAWWGMGVHRVLTGVIRRPMG